MRTQRHADALDAIARGIEAAHPQTVIEDSVSLTGQTLTVADNRTALAATAQACETAGYTTVAAQIEGESRDVGDVLATIGLACLDTGAPVEPPVAILTGGETTVTVTGAGRGGPNQQGIATVIDRRLIHTH